MAIVDIPEPTQNATNASYDIRRTLGSAVSVADTHLRRVRKLVRPYGRAAIAAELGSDGAALLTVYTKLKEAIEAAKNVTVEDLPN